MRGSPLIRSILLSLALAATGVGLMHVTAARNAPPPLVLKAADETPATAASSIPFRLLLSSPAVEITIDTGKSIRPPPGELPISGSLELDPQNPHVGLVVHWKNPATAGERRFAKLTLEIPGQETFTHVFDAPGDIDDFIELPLPATK